MRFVQNIRSFAERLSLIMFVLAAGYESSGGGCGTEIAAPSPAIISRTAKPVAAHQVLPAGSCVEAGGCSSGGQVAQPQKIETAP